MRRLIEVEGHLIDDGVLQSVLNQVTDPGGSYQLLEFDPGPTPGDVTTARLAVELPADEADSIVHNLVAIGCRVLADEGDETDVQWELAQRPGVVPEDFYATTNHPTLVRLDGEWRDVSHQRMDCVIVLDPLPRCVKFRDVQTDDRVVVGHDGIKVNPVTTGGPDQPVFCFMSGEVSAERNVNREIRDLATMMESIYQRDGRVVVVAGPAVIHTGATESLADLIRAGRIQGVLAGNALAVHDIEGALYNTSLGVDLDSGRPVAYGNRNHLRAINSIRREGSIAAAVESGLLTHGIMYECVKAGVPFVLAGSIRDDGPLPDTHMDLSLAQDRYAEILIGADLVLVLATLLHAVGVANMLPARVPIICVDINPSTALKLMDRGSGQVQGLVTDVGLFLGKLRSSLLPGESGTGFAPEDDRQSGEHRNPSPLR